MCTVGRCIGFALQMKMAGLAVPQEPDRSPGRQEGDGISNKERQKYLKLQGGMFIMLSVKYSSVSKDWI